MPPHRLLNANQFSDASAAIEAALQAFPHAVPLRTESALVKAEQGDLAASLRVVDPLRRLCWVFGDHETLTRVGRTYKNRGDKEWQKAGPPFRREAKGTPVWQLYQEAPCLIGTPRHQQGRLLPRRERGHTRVARGRSCRGTGIRREVLATCQGLQPTLPGTETSTGSSSARGRRPSAPTDPHRDHLARSFYASALALVGSCEIRMVQASWNQLCRLWHILDHAVIGPAVEEFTQRQELWAILNPGPVGDCGFDGKR